MDKQISTTRVTGVCEMSDFIGIIFLDGTGDTKITWKPEADERMAEAIYDLMQKGHVFWKVEIKRNGSFSVEKTLDRIADISERSLIVKDETLNALYRDDKLTVKTGFLG